MIKVSIVPALYLLLLLSFIPCVSAQQLDVVASLRFITAERARAVEAALAVARAAAVPAPVPGNPLESGIAAQVEWSRQFDAALDAVARAQAEYVRALAAQRQEEARIAAACQLWETQRVADMAAGLSARPDGIEAQVRRAIARSSGYDALMEINCGRVR